MTSLFVPPTPSAIGDKVSNLLDVLGESLSSLGEEVTCIQTSHHPNPQISGDEVQKLQEIITKLKGEIGMLANLQCIRFKNCIIAISQKQALAQMTETRNLFDTFAADQRRSTRETDEISVELMTAPQRDEERERLEKLRVELDLERQRFTEATIKLGKEKAELTVRTIIPVNDYTLMTCAG